jgi:hypothetical protein
MGSGSNAEECSVGPEGSTRRDAKQGAPVRVSLTKGSWTAGSGGARLAAWRTFVAGGFRDT